MNLKRSAVMGLTAALILALTLPAGGVASASPVVTLTYSTTANQTVFDQGEGLVIKAFEKVNRLIRVNVRLIPTGDYRVKLSTEFKGGQGPDIGRVNYGDIQIYGTAGFLLPLKDIITSYDIAVDKLIPGLVQAGQVDGVQLSLPLTTDTRVLWYNPTLLKAKGFNSAPKTWDDILAISKKFAGTGVYGYGFASNNDFALNYESVGPYINGAGGVILKSVNGEFQSVAAKSEPTVAAVQFFQKIVKTGAVPPGIGSTTQDTLALLFSQSKLAMMLGGPWQLPVVLANNPNMVYGTDYATVKVPARTAGGVSGSTSGGWQIGVFKNTKYPQQAGKLLAFIMRTANLVRINKPEAFPPFLNALRMKPWVFDPFFKAFNYQLDHTARPIPSVPRLPEVAAAFEKIIMPAIVDPTKSAVDALTQFDATVNAGMLDK